MHRLFIRAYLVQIVFFVVSIFGLNYVLQNYLFTSVYEEFNYEIGRGFFDKLATDLRGKTLTQQQHQLQIWQPDYGLQFSLANSDTLNLKTNERALLDQGKFFGRNDSEIFYVPIDWPAQQELLAIHVKQPANVMELQIVAYGILALISALYLYCWLRPHWRELQILQDAAKRFGSGNFSARAEVSHRSPIHELVEQFNTMAAQIESLLVSHRDLSNAVSHELRTPMARLSFELNAARKLNDPVAWQALINDMHKDLAELESLVSELLELARLEHPHNQLIQEPIPAQEWLDSVVAMVMLEAEARGITIYLTPGAPPTVKLEAHKMARALINIVRNAIYHAQSYVEISLVQQNQCFILTIDDNGEGIPQSAQVRIFEPFFRLDESRNRTTGGTGLGLSIVKQIAKAHHGDVNAEDSPLGGARFVIRWPV